jgi:LuxR family maltose regulon positive regulatory protein
LLYELNRLDEAKFYINQVLECKDKQPFARLFHVAVSASRIHQAKGNTNRATELLVQLKSEIDSSDYDIFMPKIEAELVFLSLRQGSLQDGLDWLQGCGLTHKDEVSLDLMAEHMALARALAAYERTEGALYLLERMYRLLSKEDRLRERIKVLIVQSVTLWRTGQTEAALIQLETALHLAEPEGYIRSFIDEGPMLAELLSAYLKARQDSSIPSVSYVKQLLQALNVTLDEDRSPKEILTEQEFKILLLITDGLLNKEIAHRLNIKVETVKFHIKNMYRKLGVNNRVQALQRAKQLQLLV